MGEETGICGSATEALIRSSVDGTPRSWTGSGTFNMVDVDVQRPGRHGQHYGISWDEFIGATTRIGLSTTRVPVHRQPLNSMSFSATSSETGEVLLEWRTGYEVDNLGFHLTAKKTENSSG